MDYYGGRELADAFRTVRKNTIKIAEDIPEDQYDFHATPDVRSVAEELAHIAGATSWHLQLHGVDRKTFVSFEDWGGYLTRSKEIEDSLKTRGEILDGLRKHGDEFATWLESLTDEQLAERVSFPSPVHPPSRTRFEMILAAKEHEMHHRGKLMVIERLIGIVPHLTRGRQAR
jgi:uncharacterized damage-inducible protein DinB